MYSSQLRRILGQIEPTTRVHFRGVFAIDELAQTPCMSGSYVINLDRRDEPGSHWVVVYIDPTKADTSTKIRLPPTPLLSSSLHSGQSYSAIVEYFDSYGLAPLAPELITFINRCIARYHHHKLRCRNGRKDAAAASAAALAPRVVDACIGPNFWYNSYGLQPTFTGSCGFYCVYFILKCVMGQTAADIVKLLSRIDSHYYVKKYVLDRYSLAFH